jgi:hypothetical protein
VTVEDPHTHHKHEHAHHHHSHDSEEEHSHDTAPWRYVVLLIPVLLFLLGLPNKSPNVGRVRTKVDMTEEAEHYAGALLAGGPHTLNSLVVAAALKLDEGLNDVIEVNFKDLETAASLPTKRAEYQGKAVRVRGQFAPMGGSDRVFSLVRFRIQCCAADRIQVNVPIICKEPVSNIKPSEWVEVTGRVDFRIPPGQSHYTAVLLVPQPRYVKTTDPDPNPWIS